MTKKLTWWILVIVVVVGLWYGWKSGWLVNPNTTNVGGNNTTSTGGALPIGGKLTNFLRDAASEAGLANLDTGEGSLVASISQQVGDLSQTYNENQF